MYFKYYGVIVTYHAAEQVNQVTAVKNSVFSLMDPYYLLIFTDIIVLGFYFFINKNGRNYKKRPDQPAQWPDAACRTVRGLARTLPVQYSSE
ncbi:hypothetical protein ACFTAO_44505 [Paenibacillus rhizoplanae]